MNPYIKKLNAYLCEHPPKYGYPDVESLLEMLYRYYAECNPLDNAAIKQGFVKLDHLLSRFTIRENDEVIDTVCGLCSQHERLAFIAGVHVGTRLVSELNTEQA